MALLNRLSQWPFFTGDASISNCLGITHTFFRRGTPASSFPVTETKKLTKLARFLRYEIKLVDTNTGNVGLTLSLLGDGKSDTGKRQDPLLFWASFYGGSPGVSGGAPATLLGLQPAGAGSSAGSGISPVIAGGPAPTLTPSRTPEPASTGGYPRGASISPGGYVSRPYGVRHGFYRNPWSRVFIPTPPPPPVPSSPSNLTASQQVQNFMALRGTPIPP